MLPPLVAFVHVTRWANNANTPFIIVVGYTQMYNIFNIWIISCINWNANNKPIARCRCIASCLRVSRLLVCVSMALAAMHWIDQGNEWHARRPVDGVTVNINSQELFQSASIRSSPNIHVDEELIRLESGGTNELNKTRKRVRTKAHNAANERYTASRCITNNAPFTETVH